MGQLDELDEDGGDTVFRDVIFLALAGFVAIVVMLLPFINPPAKADAEIESPGNVIVEIRWPDEVNADVDLWVEAPGDVPVGYSNQSGTIFNLLRDDLGLKNDVTALNYETTYSRGIPAGEYTINLHLYRSLSQYIPLTVTVVVSLKQDKNSSAKQILVARQTLRSVGQEVTVFRFSLDEKGRLITSSVHDMPRPLRTATK